MTPPQQSNTVTKKLDEIIETQRDTTKEIRALADRMTTLEATFKGRCDLVDERFKSIGDDLAENRRKSVIAETLTGVGAFIAAIMAGLGLTK